MSFLTKLTSVCMRRKVDREKAHSPAPPPLDSSELQLEAFTRKKREMTRAVKLPLWKV